jgi:hypothetical protein
MNTDDSLWNIQDQLPAGVMLVPVICASDKTHLTNFSEELHGWPLYLTIGNIGNDICRTAQQRSWIVIGLIACPPQGAENIHEACQSAVGNVLSQSRHLDIAGRSLEWDCADGFR